MIAADTSTWIAFLEGAAGEDTALLDEALVAKQVVMCPIVLAELFSDTNLDSTVAEALLRIPLLEIGEGFWKRAGLVRANVLAKGRKARLGDALIAQSCLEAGVALLSRDRDFRAFAETAGLDLRLGV